MTCNVHLLKALRISLDAIRTEEELNPEDSELRRVEHPILRQITILEMQQNNPLDGSNLFR